MYMRFLSKKRHLPAFLLPVAPAQAPFGSTCPKPPL